MTKAQKIIKYFAVSLALLLIVSIFSTILGIIANIFGLSLKKDTNEYEVSEIVNKIDVLDIEIKNSKLVLKNDNTFKVETNNDRVLVKEKNNKLIIKENNSVFNDNLEEIIIYLPDNYIFNEVSIDSGSGSINIDKLSTYELDFDLGAGALNIENLTVTSNASIDTGAGQVNIDNCNINNLDLDVGVGKTVINGIFTGSNDIDTGIGELEVNLNNSINNYNLIIDKGIGKIKVNNEIVDKQYIFNNGTTKIEIDGGMGNISINTLEGDF